MFLLILKRPLTQLRILFYLTSCIIMDFGVLFVTFSYSANRTRSTQIDSYVSLKKNLVTEVPQGSVLGSSLFLIDIK